MDWANEDYVRVYTRDTADDMVLSWQATALWHAMLRKFDRSGLIATKHGWMGLAKVVRMPDDVVTAAGQELLTDGRVTKVDLGFFCPNFVAAQTTRKSDKNRQRESRDRRRAFAMSNGQHIENISSGHIESRDVTRGHMTSHAIMDQSRDVTLADTSALRCSATDLVDQEVASKSVPTPDRDRDEKPSKTETKALKVDRLPVCWVIADTLHRYIIEKSPRCDASRLVWKDRSQHRTDWAHQIYLLITKDKKTVDEIREMVRWIRDREFDNHSPIVESATSFREKWDNLVNEIKRKSNGQQRKSDPKVGRIEPHPPETYADGDQKL